MGITWTLSILIAILAVAQSQDESDLAQNFNNELAMDIRETLTVLSHFPDAGSVTNNIRLVFHLQAYNKNYESVYETMTNSSSKVQQLGNFLNRMIELSSSDPGNTDGIMDVQRFWRNHPIQLESALKRIESGISTPREKFDKAIFATIFAMALLEDTTVPVRVSGQHFLFDYSSNDKCARISYVKNKGNVSATRCEQLKGTIIEDYACAKQPINDLYQYNLLSFMEGREDRINALSIELSKKYQGL